jgi:hypothetical protein
MKKDRDEMMAYVDSLMVRQTMKEPFDNRKYPKPEWDNGEDSGYEYSEE